MFFTVKTISSLRSTNILECNNFSPS